MSNEIDNSDRLTQAQQEADRLGMVAVTKDEFYAGVGSGNVHPELGRQAYDRTFGYTARWRTRHGQTVGITIGGDSEGSNRYWARPVAR